MSSLPHLHILIQEIQSPLPCEIRCRLVVGLIVFVRETASRFPSLQFLYISPHIQNIILHKKIRHEARVVELIDGEYCGNIVPIVDLEETERRKSVLDEWEVCTDPGYPLVYIHKYLEIGGEDKNEKRLLKRIFDLSKFREKYLELLFELELVVNRSIGRSADFYLGVPYTSEILLQKESLSEKLVDVIELNLGVGYIVPVLDDVFYGVFVVEDHLGLHLCLSLGTAVVLDEYFRVEVVVGISFQL